MHCAECDYCFVEKKVKNMEMAATGQVKFGNKC